MKKYIATFILSGLLFGSGVYFWTQNTQTESNTCEETTDFNQKACESERDSLKTVVEDLKTRVSAFETTEQDTNYSFATCIDGYSENKENNYKKTNEEFTNQLLRTEFVRPEAMTAFFANPAVQAIQAKGDLYQLCYTPDTTMSFVAYGEFGDYNNTIGLYDIQNDRVITDQKYNHGLGDIGLCVITGYLERNPIYNCGGGDGPGGWNKIYILDALSGKSTLLKDCSHTDEQPNTCTTNVLNLTVQP